MKEIQIDPAQMQQITENERYETILPEISELIRYDMLRYPRKLEMGDDDFEY